jgi:hypothetical protein
MTREEYVNQVGLSRVRNSYTPEQLVGTTFEGVHSQGVGISGGPVPVSTPEDVAALPSGTRYIDTLTGIVTTKP